MPVSGEHLWRSLSWDDFPLVEGAEVRVRRGLDGTVSAHWVGPDNALVAISYNLLRDVPNLLDMIPYELELCGRDPLRQVSYYRRTDVQRWDFAQEYVQDIRDIRVRAQPRFVDRMDANLKDAM